MHIELVGMFIWVNHDITVFTKAVGKLLIIHICSLNFNYCNIFIFKSYIDLANLGYLFKRLMFEDVFCIP